jgi:prevent-host-death family protein
MNNASVSYAKANLSALLRKVREGQEVLITDRGVPVARLVPARLGQLTEPARALVRRGLALPPRTPPGRTLVRELPAAPRAPRGVSLLREVLDEREEGR